jgi:hypothetical protein
MIEFRAALRALAEADVEFIVVGGAAGIAHGSARLTLDLDVVYRRTRDNIDRLANALAAHQPYPRGAPKGLPFRWDAQTILNGMNFTLDTDAGPVDLLGEIAGGGDYDALLPFTLILELYGVECRCLELGKLIEVKLAAGRPKDFEAVAELRAIQEERESEA